MNTTKIAENLSGALLQFANAIPSAIQSGARDTQAENPEYLFELLNFFPLDKVDWNAGTYDQYLFDLQKTINDNYEKGNFQVAYFYSHFIFMSYVYYCVEKVLELEPERLKDVYFPINAYAGRNDKPELNGYSSVYDFSKIPEKDIFKIFHVMGMSHDTIKELSKYISKRDDFAHATGKGNISEEDLESKIRNVKGNMNTVHKIFQPQLRKMYVDFLLLIISYDYSVLNGTFEEFIFEENLSLADIEFMCNLGISGLRDKNEDLKKSYRFARKIHCAFLEFCIENYSIQESTAFSDFRDYDYLKFKYYRNAEEYIENELGISGYSCVKDGGEFPLYECPNCDAEQLVYDQSTQEYHCFDCDITYAESEISFCERCGMLMCKSDEIVCNSCIEEAMRE